MGAAAITPGELWTRDQLAALLAGRFSPSAIAAFLLASQRRAAQVRRARPALARQSRQWMSAGAAVWIALALAGAQPWRRRLRAGLAWWGAGAVMLDWHLGMAETPDGRPLALGPADALTLLRVWLVPVAADSPVPGVVAVGALTDVLDGMAARATEPSRLGRDLEGLADACFAAAALLGARRRGWLGPGAAVAELARLGAGFGYALLVYFGTAGAPDPRVTRAARVAAPVRVAGLLAAGRGRPGLADALVLSGCAWSVAELARAAGAARRA